VHATVPNPWKKLSSPVILSPAKDGVVHSEPQKIACVLLEVSTVPPCSVMSVEEPPPPPPGLACPFAMNTCSGAPRIWSSLPPRSALGAVGAIPDDGVVVGSEPAQAAINAAPTRMGSFFTGRAPTKR
jgi:hypothetical protein